MRNLIDPSRFAVMESLGEGAQGRVYRARDLRRAVDVALKVIPAVESRSILELKHEFRVASALWHPHLVRLHELFVDPRCCYFSMELVAGVSFEESLRRSTPDRVSVLAGQLAEAVHALHQAHRIHRDIKPANLMVSEDRGVVVLDFGFTSPRGSHGGDGLGTPAFMAPELLRGIPPSLASDWFSVGAVLWEALTRRPIPRGLDGEPPDPAPCPDGVDASLWRLVGELLSPDPDARPDGSAVLRFFGRPGRRAQLIPSVGEQIRVEDIVGRRREIERLGELHDQSTSSAQVVRIAGPSGIGKTALVLGFLDTRGNDAPVHRGRCGPREAVPFNALDEVMDGAARSLLEADETLSHHLEPRLAAALPRIFPVFADVAGDGARAELPADGEQVLRLAARAFLRLIGSSGGATPILWIDDLQWADRDSVRLLSLMLEEARGERVFVILCSRDPQAQLDAIADGDVLLLGPLSEDETLRLAVSWVGDALPIARLAARGCGGSPLFLRQLVDQMAVGASPRRVSSIEDTIRSSLSALPPAARELAEFLAVVGRPVSASFARGEAGSMEGDPYDLFLLHDQRLLRGSASAQGQQVEIYHDRIRELLIGDLPGERRRALHLRVAQLLIAQSARAEEVVHHYVEGGRPQDGVRLARKAADDAAASFAFDRAADLYRLVLSIAGSPRDEQLLIENLGDALSRAGRAEEAADAYLRVADLREGYAALDFRRKASEQLLRVGKVADGMRVLSEVLRELKLPNPSTWGGTLARLAWIQVALRATSERPPPHQPDRRELQRIDACFSAGLGLNMIDVRRSMLFQALQLALARRSGDPLRISRSLAVESTYLATRGSRGSDARAEALITRAREVAEQLGDPEAIAFAELCRGVALTVSGEFRAAIPMLDSASERYRAHRDGVTWEVANCDLYKCWSSVYLGEIGRLKRLVPRLQREAEQRSDALAQIGVSSGIAVVAGLAGGAPGETWARAIAARAQLPSGGFQSLDYFDLVARTTILLYQGRGADAYALVRRAWPRLRLGLFLGLRFFRAELLYLRSRAALAMALEVDRRQRPALLADARRQARRLERERFAFASALARSVETDLLALDSPRCWSQALARDRQALSPACPLLARVSRDLLGDGPSAPADVEDAGAFLRIWAPAGSALLGRQASQ